MYANNKDEDNSSSRHLLSSGTLSISTFKENTRAAVRAVTNPQVSRFQGWTDDSLKDILVQYNVQIRGSGHATHESLVRICDEIFPDDFQVSNPDEDADNELSLEDWAEQDSAAHLIQKVYVRNKSKLQHVENTDLEPSAVLLQLSSSHPHAEEDESMLCEEDGEEEESRGQILRHQSMLRKINTGDIGDEELEVEWRKPSWKTAKRYDASMRPHRSGRLMERYDWRHATLGRHCTFTGCGEQLDLWDEGKTSEFAQFGSGITNYFKFLKFCCWIMLILSIIHLPIAIINTFGASVQYDSVTLAMTSFGNLGSADEVTEVDIPGCNQADYQQKAECVIQKDNLGLFYAFLDALATSLVIIGWKWLQTFEKSESMHLNRSTVTASDYTIRVHNIPKDNTTEAEIAAHFASLTGEAVAEVHLAYRNAKEINEYFKRGELIRKRFDVLQKIRYEKTKERRFGPKASDKRRLKKLLKKRATLTKAIRWKDAEREENVDPCPTPIQAFVTFEKEEAFVNAMSAYQLSWIRSVLCFYPQKLKFKGTKLFVTQAPEPSVS